MQNSIQSPVKLTDAAPWRDAMHKAANEAWRTALNTIISLNLMQAMWVGQTPVYFYHQDPVVTQCPAEQSPNRFKLNRCVTAGR